MRMERDEVLAENAAGVFGEYMNTFTAQGIRVDMFRRNGDLIAYVSPVGRRSAAAAMDRHAPRIKKYAEQEHLQLRVVFSSR
ncbi:MAG: hypothetical protein HYU66_17515 [Armatimonadetes bacterium]|nr:hypothetical protein [Armatimonadota bacterium]